MDRLEEDYAEQIAVQRINATEGDGPAIMRQYQILGHPALLFVDETGQEVSRLLGPQPEAVIKDNLSRIVTTP